MNQEQVERLMICMLRLAGNISKTVLNGCGNINGGGKW